MNYIFVAQFDAQSWGRYAGERLLAVGGNICSANCVLPEIQNIEMLERRNWEENE